MSLETHIFCWYAISTEMKVGPAFYAQVLGWTSSVEDDGTVVFVAPGGSVGHLQAPEGGPPAWCCFVSVEDVDRSTALATEQGSGIVVPPTDLPEGRFAVVTTPSGAVVGLYQGVASDTMAAPGPGTIHGVELQTTDHDRDLAWLASVFGFSCRADGEVHVLETDAARRGVVTASSAPVSWFLPWVQVDDLDGTLARVEAHGGQTRGAAFVDPEGHRKAVVTDPSGAAFGLLQPA